MNRAKIFTKLDLKNGYYLICIVKEDEPKIAFHTRFRLYEWNMMLFRLCNAPTIFQVIMDDLFYDMLDEGVIIYLNNKYTYICRKYGRTPIIGKRSAQETGQGRS